MGYVSLNVALTSATRQRPPAHDRLAAPRHDPAPSLLYGVPPPSPRPLKGAKTRVIVAAGGRRDRLWSRWPPAISRRSHANHQDRAEARQGGGNHGRLSDDRPAPSPMGSRALFLSLADGQAATTEVAGKVDPIAHSYLVDDYPRRRRQRTISSSRSISMAASIRRTRSRRPAGCSPSPTNAVFPTASSPAPNSTSRMSKRCSPPMPHSPMCAASATS